ncbi:SDR family oxidoreductase [Sphingobium sp. LMA1-1-1.1]|uniref:SDR family NAD(P)-dependent oxidoreductase n=1 Tax=Sphingobium sp. LMA1-1-1.1 TaxID=3135238 RepID=UPI00343A30F7
MKLDGRVAIITGTSPNIGGGIAEALAAAGASIVAVDAQQQNADGCANAIRAAGGSAIGIVCDVTDDAAVKAAVDKAMETYGRVDILVNNAAYFHERTVAEMELPGWRRVISVILDGSFLFTKYAAAKMLEGGRGGVVINVISTTGHQGAPGNIAYATAKAGMLNFTQSAAMEFAAQNIRVVSLTPTATSFEEKPARAKRWNVDVGSMDHVGPMSQKYAKRIPLQRLPNASDYGAAAVFLASDDASMITGIDLRVDGGAVARYWAWDPSNP